MAIPSPDFSNTPIVIDLGNNYPKQGLHTVIKDAGITEITQRVFDELQKQGKEGTVVTCLFQSNIEGTSIEETILVSKEDLAKHFPKGFNTAKMNEFFQQRVQATVDKPKEIEAKSKEAEVKSKDSALNTFPKEMQHIILSFKTIDELSILLRDNPSLVKLAKEPEFWLLVAAEQKIELTPEETDWIRANAGTYPEAIPIFLHRIVNYPYEVVNKNLLECVPQKALTSLQGETPRQTYLKITQWLKQNPDNNVTSLMKNMHANVPVQNLPQFLDISRSKDIVFSDNVIVPAMRSWDIIHTLIHTTKTEAFSELVKSKGAEDSRANPQARIPAILVSPEILLAHKTEFDAEIDLIHDVRETCEKQKKDYASTAAQIGITLENHRRKIYRQQVQVAHVALNSNNYEELIAFQNSNPEVWIKAAKFCGLIFENQKDLDHGYYKILINGRDPKFVLKVKEGVKDPESKVKLVFSNFYNGAIHPISLKDRITQLAADVQKPLKADLLAKKEAFLKQSKLPQNIVFKRPEKDVKQDLKDIFAYLVARAAICEDPAAFKEAMEFLTVFKKLRATNNLVRELLKQPDFNFWMDKLPEIESNLAVKI